MSIHGIMVHQNPENSAPHHILDQQFSLAVRHYGFDGEIHEGTIVIHEEVVDDVKDFFRLALEIKFPIERIIPICDKRYAWDDELSMADNNTSGFNYRTIMGTDRLSNHATGRAFDVNPKQNPYIKYNASGQVIACYPSDSTYNLMEKGTLASDHFLVKFMRDERGWKWGGDWSVAGGRIDYQHFEKP